MLFKNINILLLLPIVLLWGACTYEVDDVFDKPAAERYREIYEKTQKDLLAAEKGWVMEYFPTEDSPGYLLFVKFETTDSVTFAANNSVTSNKYQVAGSRYVISSNAEPVLNFNTYNIVFHKFSDPAPDGYGLEGDFEFFIISEDENLIELKGRKRDTKILLKKYTESISWEDYIAQAKEMNVFLFNNSVSSLLNMSVGGKTFELGGGASSIFKITESGIDSIVPEIIPFIVTPIGLRLYKPFEIDGKRIQTFKLSDDKNSLVSIDEGVEAKIVGPNLADFFFDIVNLTKSMALTSGVDDMSPAVKEIYDSVKGSIEAGGRTLNTIAFTYRKTWGQSLLIKTSRGASGAEGFLEYTMERTADKEINLSFKGFVGDFDKNGKNYYDNYSGVPDLVNSLSGKFTVSPAGNELAPNKIKFTNVANSSIWFCLTVQ